MLFNCTGQSSTCARVWEERPALCWTWCRWSENGDHGIGWWVFTELFKRFKTVHFEGQALLSHTVMPLLHFADHPYFVGVQYHPEYISRPMKPAPPYFGLLLASCGKLSSYIAKSYSSMPNNQHSDSELSEDELADELLRLSAKQGWQWWHLDINRCFIVEVLGRKAAHGMKWCPSEYWLFRSEQ